MSNPNDDQEYHEEVVVVVVEEEEEMTKKRQPDDDGTKEKPPLKRIKLTRKQKLQQKLQKKGNYVNHYELAYDQVHFDLRKRSGRPISPHNWFQHSYRANLNPKTNTKDNENRTQIVHQHANGLCIVTVGDDTTTINANEQNTTTRITSTTTVKSVDFHIRCTNNNNDSSSSSCISVSERRKIQSRMLSGKKIKNNEDTVEENIVSPTTLIATIELEETTTTTNSRVENETEVRIETKTKRIPVYSMVWGTLVELNRKLIQNPQLVMMDPLLDGYVAIIMPTGPFPPYSAKQKTIAQEK